MKAEALIIAEITGSITSEERTELLKLMRISAAVRSLSKRMHEVLDPQINDIRQIKTTSAEKIIKMAMP